MTIDTLGQSEDFVVDYGAEVRKRYLKRKWPLVLNLRSKLDEIAIFDDPRSVAIVGEDGSGRQSTLDLLVLENPGSTFYSADFEEAWSAAPNVIEKAFSAAVERVQVSLYQEGKRSFLVVDDVAAFLFQYSIPSVRPVEVVLNAIKSSRAVPTIFIGNHAGVRSLVEESGWAEDIYVIEMTPPKHADLVAGLAQKDYGLEVLPEALEAAAEAARSANPQGSWRYATTILEIASQRLLHDSPLGLDPARHARAKRYVEGQLLKSLEDDLEFEQAHGLCQAADTQRRISETKEQIRKIETQIEHTLDPVYDAKFRLQQLRAELRDLADGNLSKRTIEEISREIAETEAKIPGFGDPKVLKAEDVRKVASRFLE